MQGFFTAENGKVVFYNTGTDQPIPEKDFFRYFGESFPAFTPECEILVSYKDPDSYLKHVQTRYHGHSWTEITEGEHSNTCPMCDSYKCVEIQYGYPAPQDPDADKDWRKTQVLGGCCLMPGAPKFSCLCCGHEFGQLPGFELP